MEAEPPSVGSVIGLSYTLNSTTSPSFTTYSLPSVLRSPFSRADAYDPAESKSSQNITSARMNLSWKSVWIAAPACGAVESFFIVHPRVSSSPVVKKVIKLRTMILYLKLCKN